MIPAMIPLVFSLLLTHPDAFLLDLSYVWNGYQDLYLKDYGTSDITDKIVTFYDASASVIQHNIEADLKKHSFWIGLNQWSHMKKSELQKTLTCIDAGNSGNASRGSLFKITILDPPDSLDYRDLGMVTTVRNQGCCSSCYAFSALASLEGVWAKANNALVELSEQNIIDCSDNNGCSNGAMENVFQYIKQNNGIDTYDSYPYEDDAGQCRFKSENVGATCSGYVILSQNEGEILKGVYEKGPAAVYFYSGDEKFEHYKNGIYDSDNCDKQINVAVTIVGYGTDEGSDMPYWIVKNSWGTEWGENGYVRVVRNKNMCRIATQGGIATV